MEQENFLEEPETKKRELISNEEHTQPLSEQNNPLQDNIAENNTEDSAPEEKGKRKPKRVKKAVKEEDASTENEDPPIVMPYIPLPISKPDPVPLTEVNLSYVIFDLETTGFNSPTHITQLAAISSSSSFSKFVKPKVEIRQEASEKTGIKYDSSKQQMYSWQKPVESVTIRQAIDNFFQFLGDQSVILVGHNIRTFDCRVLFDALESCNANEKLQNVVGFLDTLELIKKTHPGIKKKLKDDKPYSQENIYGLFFKETYKAHDALEDVKALQRIFLHVKSTNEDEVLKSTIDHESVHAIWEYNSKMKQKFASYKWAINKAITKSMAEKAAGSGLKFDDLELVHRLYGLHGVKRVFSELTAKGKPRVTKDKKVMGKLSQYLAEQEQFSL